VSEREGLIARIRQIRRAAAAADEPPTRPPINQRHDELRALETRVSHLEKLVQGLQDSVHRESMRHSRRLNELEARIEPAALRKAMSEDARERGL
jgi:hypothetical protein